MLIHTYLWCIAAVSMLSSLSAGTAAEAVEMEEMEALCYPELYKNSRKSCECVSEHSTPWGLPVLNVDCSFKNFLTADFSEILPLYADNLDLSWNQLQSIPSFVSNTLTQLNLMHNNITVIVSKNFVKVTNLRELYLNWNSIQNIEANAFSDLAHLLVLDLSHNNLHNLESKIFDPLQNLQSLFLSWNRQLNQTDGIQEVDFYQAFGVNRNLHVLKLKACNLNNIVLPNTALLKELDLGRNLLNQVPTHLPEYLEVIHLSENLLESLLEEDTKRLRHIRELYMEDMPHLESIEENSFVPLESLEKVSFQNSRILARMHEYAFGRDAIRSPKLHTMIFRGTVLPTYNSTLSAIFFQLATLDLNGVPLHCDCNLVWMKGIQVETNGHCFKPSRLRGISLSTANSNDFSCELRPRWIYSIIVLALIALSAICIYVIVVGWNRNGGVTLRRKIGAGSPYARVRIEPNRQENY